MATCSTYQTLDTESSADSTEWCPHSNHHDILLCGTYQLDTSSSKSDTQASDDSTALQRRQTRHGRLYVHRLTSGQELTTETTLDMPGILDIKWCPTSTPDGSLMALVNSVGQLRLYRMTTSDTDTSGRKVDLSEVINFDLGGDCLGLSLDWSNRVHNESAHICSSTSTGDIHVHAVDGGSLQPLTSWKGHDFEAWITAYNYWDTNLIYTGGDDNKLKGWDMRMNPRQAIFVNRRHTMGVTSIQCSPIKEHLLCTGSYDEDLMLWDTRNMRSPVVTTPLGGGIWRIKWEPMHGQHILTATMYNGFHIVDASNITEEPLPILCHYDKHTSLGYGADWCFMDLSSQASGKGKDRMGSPVPLGNTNIVQVQDKLNIPVNKNCLKTVATCSFYDHVLHLWQINLHLTS
ncbi:diphthine methyltransferase-like [Ylistrum balloti]|uniref:diphthine methyltransferase-like n=1 Tax=Ylistrum balloti TaxID=509963 RepID=UPI002905ED2F|nr:diphthine methyltransferase-like [Ylistrum balloti]